MTRVSFSNQQLFHHYLRLTQSTGVESLKKFVAVHNIIAIDPGVVRNLRENILINNF